MKQALNGFTADLVFDGKLFERLFAKKIFRIKFFGIKTANI
jgi:hypothetical protein